MMFYVTGAVIGATGGSVQDAQCLGVTLVVVLFLVALALLPFVKSGRLHTNSVRHTYRRPTAFSKPIPA